MSSAMQFRRQSMPYVLLMLAGVLALTVFPDIALWLPRKMF